MEVVKVDPGNGQQGPAFHLLQLNADIKPPKCGRSSHGGHLRPIHRLPFLQATQAARCRVWQCAYRAPDKSPALMFLEDHKVVCQVAAQPCERSLPLPFAGQ